MSDWSAARHELVTTRGQCLGALTIHAPDVDRTN